MYKDIIVLCPYECLLVEVSHFVLPRKLIFSPLKPNFYRSVGFFLSYTLKIYSSNHLSGRGCKYSSILIIHCKSDE